MRYSALLRQSLMPFVDIIYPPRCPLCGEAVASQSGLCSPCWGSLQLPGQPSCMLCQAPLDHTAVIEGAICAPWMLQPPQHDGIAAGTLYNAPSRQLVLDLKYAGRIGLAAMMARLIAARLPEMRGEWLVAPVPLNRWRLWRRGYNQAALLAMEISKLRSLRYEPVLLHRTRHTPSLGGMGREQRKKTLAGAIAVKPSQAAKVKGSDILLVDDVLTSGATSSACVNVLKKAGARRVVVGCFARVLPENGQAQR
ncbi:ComF family protein [Altererythrobacter sp. SALINAS58]|uniref:ComF family protein n=1 Tax=Alteripontixanthobacter muriae TaxID=2705546 RepID=UPI001576D0D8|nr:ComF family protein [Alteripontixanthobacter muriae]NTZ41826.1 ComF family protein [Alteripontixanthobacter muriae]